MHPLFIIGYDLKYIHTTSHLSNEFDRVLGSYLPICSVDDDIWFRSMEDVFRGEMVAPEVYSIVYKIQTLFHGMHPPLWDNLEEIIAFYREYHQCLPHQTWLIAVAILRDNALEYYIQNTEFIHRFIHLEATCKPNVILDSWEFLGYDVADAMRISGLHNCGGVSQVKRILNRYALFSHYDDAQTFRMKCDHEVTDHSPFFVYALYRIPVV